jgi:hypothetical protein
MALRLTAGISFSDDGEQLFFEDATGTYNATTNTGGYGAPNIASTTVTSVQLNLLWANGTTVYYTFTVSSGTITAASVTDVEGTVYNFLSDLASTVFPIVDPNFLDLTDTFDDEIVLPSFDDGQYTVTYKIIGSSGGTAYSYTTSKTFFRDVDLCCCLSEKRLTVDPNCESCGVKERVNEIVFWHEAALCAVETGKANSVALAYFEKAQELCDEDCDCN